MYKKNLAHSITVCLQTSFQRYLARGTALSGLSERKNNLEFKRLRHRTVHVHRNRVREMGPSLVLWRYICLVSKYICLLNPGAIL